jgi:hypothetical protein
MPVINLARQCFSSERRNVAYPVVSAQGSTPLLVNPPVLCCLLRPSLTEVPSLHRSYPASSVLRTSPPPHTAGLALASCQLIPTAITAGASRVASDPLCLHAVATTPAGSMELIRSYRSPDVGLPHITVGSAPASQVSRPAQRSLGLQPADLPSRLMRPSTPEAPAALLPPPPLRLLPGGANQFPGGSFTR